MACSHGEEDISTCSLCHSERAAALAERVEKLQREVEFLRSWEVAEPALRSHLDRAEAALADETASVDRLRLMLDDSVTNLRQVIRQRDELTHGGLAFSPQRLAVLRALLEVTAVDPSGMGPRLSLYYHGAAEARRQELTPEEYIRLLADMGLHKQELHGLECPVCLATHQIFGGGL